MLAERELQLIACFFSIYFALFLTFFSLQKKQTLTLFFIVRVVSQDDKNSTQHKRNLSLPLPNIINKLYLLQKKIE